MLVRRKLSSSGPPAIGAVRTDSRQPRTAPHSPVPHRCGAGGQLLGPSPPRAGSIAEATRWHRRLHLAPSLVSHVMVGAPRPALVLWLSCGYKHDSDRHGCFKVHCWFDTWQPGGQAQHCRRQSLARLSCQRLVSAREVRRSNTCRLPFSCCLGLVWWPATGRPCGSVGSRIFAMCNAVRPSVDVMCW